MGRAWGEGWSLKNAGGRCCALRPQGGLRQGTAELMLSKSWRKRWMVERRGRLGHSNAWPLCALAWRQAGSQVFLVFGGGVGQAPTSGCCVDRWPAYSNLLSARHPAYSRQAGSFTVEAQLLAGSLQRLTLQCFVAMLSHLCLSVVVGSRFPGCFCFSPGSSLCGCLVCLCLPSLPAAERARAGCHLVRISPG